MISQPISPVFRSIFKTNHVVCDGPAGLPQMLSCSLKDFWRAEETKGQKVKHTDAICTDGKIRITNRATGVTAGNIGIL